MVIKEEPQGSSNRPPQEEIVAPRSGPSALMGAGQAGRQYRLSVWITPALYRKVVRAQRQLRQPDGSRADLAGILELGLDALLHSRLACPPIDESTAESEVEPDTVRAPYTQRWHPAAQ